MFKLSAEEVEYASRCNFWSAAAVGMMVGAVPSTVISVLVVLKVAIDGGPVPDKHLLAMVVSVTPAVIGGYLGLLSRRRLEELIVEVKMRETPGRLQ